MAREVALGVVTSVGGFLEIGSIATASQGGAVFGYQLGWAVLLGGVCTIFLTEMSGRFAAVSQHTISAAFRERFGFKLFLIPLCSLVLVMLLVLASNLGGVCAAAELATGIDRRVWALPVLLAAWALLWWGSFGTIEKGVSLLGLVTIAFIVAAVLVHPDPGAVARGLVPSLPSHSRATYWFTAISILGASLTPYLFFFYSSGALEDRWSEKDLGLNRVVATVGMGFGTLIALAVLVCAGAVFFPAGMKVEHYRQLALLLTEPMGRAGFWLFVAALGIACLGAALEISLATAYVVAQGFGWRWGENTRPREAARFSAVFSVVLILASVLVVVGADPLKLTMYSMALTAVTLPVAVFPFLILMNDETYLRERVNHPLSNAVVLVVIGLSAVIALVTIPLQVLGGGG